MSFPPFASLTGEPVFSLKSTQIVHMVPWGADSTPGVLWDILNV